MGLSGISSTQLAVLAVIVVLTALMVGNARRRLRERGPSPSEYAREQISRLKEHREVKGDLEQLMVELHEAARRLNAQLDTKAAKLEILIHDADQRIASLRSADAQDAAQPLAPEVAAGAPQALDVTVDDSTASSDEEAVADPVRHRILALAREGKSPVQIARATGIQPGEVELILALEASGRAGRANAPPT